MARKNGSYLVKQLNSHRGTSHFVIVGKAEGYFCVPSDDNS